MILQSVVVAFLVTFVATPLARSAAGRLRLLDHPNERSSHRKVTPRSGGLAIALGLALAGALGADHRAVSIALGGMLLVVVGVLDDRYGLSPWPRLACQALAAFVVVGTAGGLERLPLPRPLDVPLGPLGGALAVVWIVAVVNFYNFMDGIDGLASLQGVVTAATAALALSRVDPAAAALGAALAGACAGFLPFNWAQASVFLGDAGSGLIGYTLATLPFLLAGEGRPGMVVLVGTSLFLFLADATTCLVRRVARRERWYEAHREHLYQRWVRVGARHGTVTAWLGLGAVATSAPALVAWTTGRPAWAWVALGLGVAAMALEWTWVGRLERRVGLRA